MTSTLLLAFTAGILSTLSPCVLPLLPVILAAAVSESRLGPLALSFGLALSFLVIGMTLALAGSILGLDQSVLRAAGGVILVLLGLTLALPSLSERAAAFAAPAGALADRTFGGFATSGVKGQFALGLLLGAAWSPCVGPTLGAASVLAAQGKDITAAALTMAVFGLGAAIPLLALGMLSREAMSMWRDRLFGAGKTGKIVLGGLLMLIGLFVVTGLDKHLEAALVAASPAWLTDLTTRF